VSDYIRKDLTQHRNHWSCLCGACKRANRDFANALRDWLGLSPLYQDERTKSPHYRVSYWRRKRVA
jgi:hypothetical protein